MTTSPATARSTTRGLQINHGRSVTRGLYTNHARSVTRGLYLAPAA